MDFEKDEVFAYNLMNKKIFAYSSIIIILAILFVIFHYFLFLRGSTNMTVQFIENLFQHFVDKMSSSSLLGVFYTGAVGGLFFLYLPVEVFYLNFLRNGMHPVLVGTVFIVGILISFTFNYHIGYFFADISKTFIGPKKFYKMKVIINNYGGLAVFLFNATPLSAQPLGVLLGVFKYDRIRFFIYVILGQVTKAVVLSVGFAYFSTALI